MIPTPKQQGSAKYTPTRSQYLKNKKYVDNTAKGENKMIGKYVIVRGDRSGVFAGILREKNGREVVLTDCRRLWYWDGAASISQLAVTGTTTPESCKFTVAVDEICITDAIEIIPCSPAAKKNIQEVKIWTR